MQRNRRSDTRTEQLIRQATLLGICPKVSPSGVYHLVWHDRVLVFKRWLTPSIALTRITWGEYCTGFGQSLTELEIADKLENMICKSH